MAYYNLLVRDTLNETGTNPTPLNDDYWASPDIIPYQEQFLSWEMASTYYGKDLGESIVGGQTNNIYVRALNTSSNAMTGTVNLYWVPSNLLMLPNQWTALSTINTFADANNNPSIAPGDVALITAPFIIQTLVNPTTGNHICLIAVVNNNGVPPAIPSSFSSNAAYAQWITGNPNIAQRNVNYYPGGNSLGLINEFGNSNNATAKMIFSITGPAALAGGTVAANCVDSRLPMPFSQTVNFTSLDQNSSNATFMMAVPPNIGTVGSASMSMSLIISMPNNGTIPPNSAVTVDYYQVPSASLEDPAEQAMTRHYELAIANETGQVNLQTLALIKLGSTLSIVSANM
ncbi:hypothetical protein [Chitinophaga sp. Cy-1792]|uniref:hypothetical protein n=1 Tax=Chitinophaga sp. Cy-1792 TaxID=2608339 RepID=UPI00142337D1|nr:hypothetical protein [Chitinophaga sp. Cy-1792]NIG56181.1 hypothetical protein [Chitinophaga sp. Cy-1792]